MYRHKSLETYCLQVAVDDAQRVHVLQARDDVLQLSINLSKTVCQAVQLLTHQWDWTSIWMSPQEAADGSFRHPLANRAKGVRRGDADKRDEVGMLETLPDHSLE
jgi:hypothetical protein